MYTIALSELKYMIILISLIESFIHRNYIIQKGITYSIQALMHNSITYGYGVEICAR